MPARGAADAGVFDAESTGELDFVAVSSPSKGAMETRGERNGVDGGVFCGALPNAETDARGSGESGVSAARAAAAARPETTPRDPIIKRCRNMILHVIDS
jgi:hypothetical protein